MNITPEFTPTAAAVVIMLLTECVPVSGFALFVE